MVSCEDLLEALLDQVTLLAESVKSLELAIREGDWDEVDTKIEEVEDFIDVVKLNFETYMDNCL